MWLTIAVITVIAAIGFGVLALAAQWLKPAEKANGQE